ncbi:hypothetical protein H7J71_23085 [Mycolicibacterium peregrinum]|uniref:hypothetical protein n=1 Tax=Mycolicibacterium peregrinum TaxID=43304 RepID=UPI000A149336|nr:hypothetical protein [Mycolicibacterium peregrinum]MCV7204903.1 hypothetical protein [Mycolicibacterium peregrinum]ORW59517.1 hypothetical protein AWC21_12450 [Mycolicibacterium peregrinum]
MAPSGEHRPENLGAAAVHAAAVATSNAAIALRKQVSELHTNGAGKTVATRCETLTAQAVAAEKLAETLSVTAKALKLREDAAGAWNRDAPKDSELEAARKAVTDARKKLADASAASGDTSAASTELENAQKKLGELVRKRREADAAFDKAEEKADAELSKVRAVEVAGGTPAPGTDTGTPGTTSPSTAPSTGPSTSSAGTPAKATPGAGKPSSTPSATPATKPSTPTETSGGDDLSGLLTALASQQQQQPQSAQQAATPTAQATPAAATPQQTQPEKNKDTAQDKVNPWDRIVGSDGILDTGDLAGIIGTPLTLGGGSAPTHATPAATVTPSSPATPAPSATGLSAGTVTQPVTSGTSAQGLNTATDVSGRPGEQQRGPFSVGPETKTSGATGTGTSATSPAHASGTRSMGGGMPMVPMGAMGGPGGGGAGKEKEQVTLASGSAESDLLHGRHTAAEAVPGGTIAQKDHPRRRPPESDAA